MKRADGWDGRKISFHTASRRTAVGAVRSAIAVHVASRRWLGVPVHTQLKLPDTGLRFRIGERSCFHGMIEDLIVYLHNVIKLSPVALTSSTHAFFGSLGRLSVRMKTWPFIILTALVLSGCGHPNPIDRVVRQASSNPFFFKGPFNLISLPATAPVEEVVTQAFEHAFPLPIRPGKIELLTKREFKIHEQPCIATLVQTSGGQKVVLLRYEAARTNWWSRIYDQ